LSQWERSSKTLFVSAKWNDIFEKFTEYFDEETVEI
jgi:hypothetical protein